MRCCTRDRPMTLAAAPTIPEHGIAHIQGLSGEHTRRPKPTTDQDCDRTLRACPLEAITSKVIIIAVHALTTATPTTAPWRPTRLVHSV